jgi:REP element-mobilizing transposase RayT
MHEFTASEREFLTKLRHARYQIGDVPYHILSKTLRGYFYLLPRPVVTKMIAGVVGRAQHLWPLVRLYGYGFLTNHFHLMLDGPTGQVSSFVGYIKREISRCLGVKFNLPGSIWHNRFTCTALPTATSQIKCLDYILRNSVKEDLVERPEQWPGLHCAKQLLTGKSPEAIWFEGTEYGKEKRRLERKGERRTPRERDYHTRYTICLTVIPPWQGLTQPQQKQAARTMIEELVIEERRRRVKEGKRVVGVSRLRKMTINHRKLPPTPPWYQERKRQIVAWASPRDAETQEYLLGYWMFQNAFQDASKKYRAGQLDIPFPFGAWRPPILNLNA